ncbi:MAG: dephospho-CoA kinase, partial [Muribaculaceae bacterium]|nr:dephospho-CoA kinase [Muribaculaceae bacterium]
MCSRTLNPNGPLIIAIAGGIGCGKSVVSEILRKMGHQVYDCDSRAKKLMEDATIIQEIASHISKTVINPDGTLSRQRLGEIVFTDHEKLQLLNNIVHH